MLIVSQLSPTAWTLVGSLAAVVSGLAGAIVVVARRYVRARDRIDEIHEETLPLLRDVTEGIDTLSGFLDEQSRNEGKIIAILRDMQKDLSRVLAQVDRIREDLR